MEQFALEALSRLMGKIHASFRLVGHLERKPWTAGRILTAIYTYQEQIKGALAEGNSRTQVLRRLYELADEDRTPPDIPLSCKKGCAFCCHINVSITELEADLIKEHCRENNIPIDYKQMKKQLDLDEKTHARSEHSRCAFLGKDNACTVYEVRPWNCRNYEVGSPAEMCNAKKYRRHEVMVHVSEDREVLHSAAHSIGLGKQGSMAKIFLHKVK